MSLPQGNGGYLEAAAVLEKLSRGLFVNSRRQQIRKLTKAKQNKKALCIGVNYKRRRTQTNDSCRVELSLQQGSTLMVQGCWGGAPTPLLTGKTRGKVKAQKLVPQLSDKEEQEIWPLFQEASKTASPRRKGKTVAVRTPFLDSPHLCSQSPHESLLEYTKRH